MSVLLTAVSLALAQSVAYNSESESCSVVSNSLWPHGLYSPWNSPGQNTGVGSLSLLQGIFPTQGLNPGLLHHRQILYQPQGSQRILEWVAYPLSSGSSWPRNRTGCIAGGFFTNWAIRAYNGGSVNISGMNGWQIWLLFGSSKRIQRTSTWVGRAGVDFIDET